MNRMWSRWMMIATVLVPGSLLAQASERSPFEPEGSVVAPVQGGGDADLDALQFSGVSSIGEVRSFNFTDSRSRRSFWVALHGTEQGFTVVSYDEGAEQVLVRRGSVTKPISLRKAVLVAVAPAPLVRASAVPTPAPVAGAAQPAGKGVDEIKNPKTPAEVKQAEFEARMLVSDLLDISMQERARQKALREAQARGQVAPNPR